MKRTGLFEDSDDLDPEDPVQKHLPEVVKRKNVRNMDELAKELMMKPEVDERHNVVTIQKYEIDIDSSSSSDSSETVQTSDEDEEASYIVIIPDEVDVRAWIDKIIMNGGYLDESEKFYPYYLWRKHARYMEATWWDTAPFKVGGMTIIPPGLPPFQEKGNGPVQTVAQTFEKILRELIDSPSVLESAGLFFMDNASKANQLGDTLLRAIESPDATFEELVARLHLVSDILFNARGHANVRKVIELRITDMIAVFAGKYHLIQGRIKAERIKRPVSELVELWEKWGVFPKLLCRNLLYMFTAGYRDEVIINNRDGEQEADYDGVDIEMAAYHEPALIDLELDGTPIKYC